MINETVAFVAILIESIGILIAEKRTALLLFFATIIMIILFFMI